MSVTQELAWALDRHKQQERTCFDRERVDPRGSRGLCSAEPRRHALANAGPNTNGSQFFIVQNQHLPYSKKEIARGGWPEPIAEIYAEQGGTPHLDRRHTVFGQLADEASYEVLDAIAGVETGAMDKPVEDVVIETIEIED